MRAALIVAAVLVLSPTSGHAQSPAFTTDSPTDFSGTWQLDHERSKYYEGLRPPDMIMVISQKDSVINVTRTIKDKKKDRVQHLTYYTDSRGEKNPLLYEGKRESRTSWENRRLISTFKLTTWLSGSGEFYTQRARDIWELSKDGRTLVITTETDEPEQYVSDFDRRTVHADRNWKVFRKVP